MNAKTVIQKLTARKEFDTCINVAGDSYEATVKVAGDMKDELVTERLLDLIPHATVANIAHEKGHGVMVIRIQFWAA